MGRKYFIQDGKKVFVDELDVKDVDDTGAEDGADGSDPVDDEEENIDETAKAFAKQIVGQLKLGELGELTKKVDALMSVATPKDSKLAQILNGKDYVRDRQSLTKEEVVVGFFHALVTRNDHAIKALSGGTSADGGYLLPQDFMNELNRELMDMVVMRKLARVVPMRRDVMVIPRVTSGVQVYWTAENAAKTTTTAAFTQDTLTARKMAAILYASDELVEDARDSGSFDIVQLIITLFAEAIATVEELAFMQGNGTTQPTGLETARTNSVIAAISAAGAQNFDSIMRLEHSLAPQYRANAKFLASDQTILEMRLLKDSQNRYLWQEPLSAGQPASFHGYPVFSSQHLPKGVVYFGDFKRGYWIGDRRMMSVKVTQDSETAFTKDQTAIRVVQRVAGNVVLPGAIKALTGF